MGGRSPKCHVEYHEAFLSNGIVSKQIKSTTVKYTIKRRVHSSDVARKSDINDFQLVQGLDDITVRLHRVLERHPYVIVTSCGIKLDSHTVSTPYFD